MEGKGCSRGVILQADTQIPPLPPEAVDAGYKKDRFNESSNEIKNHVMPEFKANRDTVIKALERNEYALRYATPERKVDREAMRKPELKAYCEIGHEAAKHKTDREFHARVRKTEWTCT